MSEKDYELVLVTKNKPSIHYSTGDYVHIEPGGNEAWKAEVVEQAAFVERWLAEEDNSTLQIIPYVLIYDRHTKEIFSYQRKGGGEKRLEGKYSIGIGGHINDEDKFDEQQISWDTVFNGAVREVCEEIVVEEENVKTSLHEIGIVFTPSDDGGKINKPGPLVGEVHIGIIYGLPVEHEVSVNETELVNATFVKYPQNASKYEKWSQLILSKIDSIRTHLKVY